MALDAQAHTVAAMDRAERDLAAGRIRRNDYDDLRECQAKRLAFLEKIVAQRMDRLKDASEGVRAWRTVAMDRARKGGTA